MPPRSSSPICERSLDLTLIGIGRLDIPQCSPKHFRMEVFYRTFSGGQRPSKQARKMIDRVDKRLVFKPLNNRPFLHGETEPCINGRILAIGAYFNEPNDALANQLLGEQLEDGGWNCEARPFL